MSTSEELGPLPPIGAEADRRVMSLVQELRSYSLSPTVQERAALALEAAVELLIEARESMLNLAPYYRRERDGCFGERQADCACTTCKIVRLISQLQNSC